MKKLILSFVFLVIILNIVQSQNSKVHMCTYGENNKGAELCAYIQMNSFSTNLDAQKAAKLITDVVGLKPNFILVPCASIKNCAAVTLDDGLRYIVYDSDFMKNIATAAKTEWTSTSILAHEIGHHLNAHTLSASTKSQQREEELEADEFSGFVLCYMGATLEEAQAAMNTLSHPTCNEENNYDHPCKEKRIQAIKIGFEKAKVRINSQSSKPVEQTKEKMFYEDFKNNTNNWELCINRGACEESVNIQNGTLILYSKCVYWCEGINTQIDKYENFEIETEAKILKMDEYEMTKIGLGWGCTDYTGYRGNFFECNNKHFKIYGYSLNGSEIKINIPLSDVNILEATKFKIKKQDNVLSFYINNKKVYECSNMKLHGNKVGLLGNPDTGSVYNYLSIIYK